MKGVAAGAAAFAAISMAGVPGMAITSADPGGSHSARDGGHSRAGDDGPGRRGPAPRDGGRDGSRGGFDRSGVDRSGVGRRDGGRPGPDSRGPRDGNGARDGSGNRDGNVRGQWPGSAGWTDRTGDPVSDGSSGQGASDVAVNQRATASRTVAVQSVTPSADTAVSVESVNPAVAADTAVPAPADSAAAAAGGSGSGGGGAIPTPVVIVVPSVTFGDGRSPAPAGVLAEEAGAPQAVASTVLRVSPVEPAISEPVVELPTTAAGVMPAPLAAEPRPWPLSRPPVTAVWGGHAESSWPAGLLFGIAGLLLAPLGGIWLGQRQARAAKAASHLVSR